MKSNEIGLVAVVVGPTSGSRAFRVEWSLASE